MTISSIPGWVHSLEDYRLMFDLEDHHLSCSILDYPAGISCFNADMQQLGFPGVVSVDMHYDLSAMDMSKHMNFVIQSLANRVDDFTDHLRVNAESEVENLLNTWNVYAQRFMSDYSDGQHAGRYRVGHMLHLPFEDDYFDLALSSDMLFCDTDFNAQAIVDELCRVAKEVRIFPLLNQTGQVATELGPLMLTLQQDNLGVEVKEVPYLLRKKNNAMLRIWSRECAVVS